MKNLLLRLLRIRGLEDPGEIRRARLILVAGLGAFVNALAICIEGVTNRDQVPIFVPLVAAIPAVAAVLFAAKGRLAAAELMAGTLVLYATVAAILMYGPVSNRLGGILVATVFVGIALRPWLALSHAFMAIALVLIAAAAQRAGVPIPLSASGQPAWHGILRHVFLATAFVATFAHGFRRLMEALGQHTRELEFAHA
jgi:hypothetical protein